MILENQIQLLEWRIPYPKSLKPQCIFLTAFKEYVGSNSGHGSVRRWLYLSYLLIDIFLGWFPFLFYSPTWVGEIYLRYSSPQSAPNSGDTLGEMGRIGSLSLVVFSVVQFTGSILLPWVVRSPADEKPGFTPRPPTSIAPIITPLIETLNKIKPDLITAWMFSHLIFAAAMLLAPLVQSLHFATILVAICGVYVHTFPFHHRSSFRS